MKKIFLLALLLSFQICYLEWGKENSAFVFEIEYQLLFQRNDAANSFMHPLVLLPFLGQLMVLFSLFQKQPNKWLVLAGLISMGILVLLLFAIGLMSKNVRIALSTLPFILSAIWIVRSFRQQKAAQAKQQSG